MTKKKEERENIIPLPTPLMKKILGSGESSSDIQRSNLVELSDAMDRGFGQVGAIDPPLDPLALTRLTSMSGTLRPLIDAMAVNIHGFGYNFDPVIDLDASDAIDRVRAAILLEAEAKAEAEGSEDIETPTDENVKERIESLREQMRREKAKLDTFFSNVNNRYTFTRISRKTQVDKETTGFAAIEARRDGRGELSRLSHAPSWTFRAMALGKSCDADIRVRASDISYRTVKEPIRYRRFVQIYEQQTVYFKEFGDKRVMSAKTGQYYDDIKKLKREEGEWARAATELLWFNLDSTESDVYGMIRWSGCIPGVVGSREQAEVNLLFFRSKAIPPMVILVSGGKLAKGAREKLQELIQHEIKGVENFHKILVIEAEPSRGPMTAGLPSQDKVKIEIRPLTESIFKDALFQGYARENKNELGESFRIPPMMRGDTTNLNRATAKIAREATEQLVFGPERRDFEFDINRTLLADMGIMLWKFRLNAPESTDSEQLVSFVKELLQGAISVNESRRIMSRVLGIELPPYDADWARMPLKHALAGMAPEPLPEETDDADTGEDSKGSENKEEEELEELDKHREQYVRMAIGQKQFQDLFEVLPENNPPGVETIRSK